MQAIGVMQLTNPQILLGPSICCNVDPIISPWNIDQVIAANFVSEFNNQLKVLSVQHYPRGKLAQLPILLYDSFSTSNCR